MQLKIDPYFVGTIILKFNMPKQFVDEINKLYDEKSEKLEDRNNELAGKIAKEKNCDEIMTESLRQTFLNCFKQYITHIQKPNYIPVLDNVWINDMKANEYNPFHFHMSPMSDVGLSSVLMLNRPSTYGKEVSRPDTPSNGWLEFTGGNSDPLSISQVKLDAQVGDLFVFPYTLLHGVYPFNGTDEIRRTLSYNCNLMKPGLLMKPKLEKKYENK